MAANFRNKISMQPVRSHGVKGPPSFLLVGDSGMGGGSLKAKSSQ